MLGHKRIPSCEGGVEVVVEELSVRMSELGHSVTCYNRKGHHVAGREFDAKHMSEFKGVKLKDVITIDKKGLAAMTASLFASIAAAFGKYDVVHIHAEGPAFMCGLPKLFGKKVIVTVHGLDHMRAKWGKFASRYILWGEKNAVRYADEIIVLSQGVKDYFLSTYNRETKFIPNGVERKTKCPPEEITRKWGLTENGYILYIGRLVPEKGCHYLIDAFKQTKTDKKLVIAGSTSDTDDYSRHLKELAEGDNRIIFTGFVQGRPKRELYSGAYCFSLPSDLEGMPLTLLEAMSYGSCCLVSDIAECTEVVEDNAVIFKKSDINDLRDKLQMICDDKNLVESYKKNASDFICNKYNWDDVTDETLKLYYSK